MIRSPERCAGLQFGSTAGQARSPILPIRLKQGSYKIKKKEIINDTFNILDNLLIIYFSQKNSISSPTGPITNAILAGSGGWDPITISLGSIVIL